MARPSTERLLTTQKGLLLPAQAQNMMALPAPGAIVSVTITFSTATDAQSLPTGHRLMLLWG